jgi:hypothetical protein
VADRGGAGPCDDVGVGPDRPVHGGEQWGDEDDAAEDIGGVVHTAMHPRGRDEYRHEHCEHEDRDDACADLCRARRSRTPVRYGGFEVGRCFGFESLGYALRVQHLRSGRRDPDVSKALSVSTWSGRVRARRAPTC